MRPKETKCLSLTAYFQAPYVRRQRTKLRQPSRPVDAKLESMDGSMDDSVDDSMDGSIDGSMDESIFDPSIAESTGINSVGSNQSGTFHADHIRTSGKAEITWSKYEQNWKRFRKWLVEGT